MEVLGTTDQLNGLTLGEKKRVGPGGKPVVNDAIVGEWADAKAEYKGPKLSRRAWENEHDAKAEGLDYVFRISESWLGRAGRNGVGIGAGMESPTGVGTLGRS